MSIQQLMSDRPELLPALTLAYIGDGVYELQVRKHLLRLGIYKVDDLHKRAISLVCANTQARLAAAIQEQLTPFEPQRRFCCHLSFGYWSGNPYWLLVFGWSRGAFGLVFSAVMAI